MNRGELHDGDHAIIDQVVREAREHELGQLPVCQVAGLQDLGYDGDCIGYSVKEARATRACAWLRNKDGGEVLSVRSQGWTRKRIEMNPKQQAQVEELIESLPPILPDVEIIEICAESAARSKGTTEYQYSGLSFEVPEHVHVPGATSRTIHDQIVVDGIALKDKCYIAMGVGCGVEPVIAAMKKARKVYAVDIDEESIQATTENFGKLVGDESSTELHTFVSDLLRRLPDNIRADVITFNPPAVHVPLSEDPDVIRSVCTGPDVVRRLFAETREKTALAEAGQIVITVSNSSDLRGIVTSGVEHGFIPSTLALHTWPKPYENLKTHVFSFRFAKV